MQFVRFAITLIHPTSGHPRGVFSALYELERRGALSEAELAWFREQEAWFEVHLKRPERFRRSARVGAQAKALSWFKTSATEHVSRMHALVALLRAKDVPVDMETTDRPGYITYEDEFQVTAEPFREKA